jgi:DNA-binding transcriptional regulator YiaG
MKLWTANKETGTRIEPVASVEEGLKLIAEYEEQDKAEGTYQDGFYDVVDEDYCSVSITEEKINNLKELRKELGWSQAELSNQLNIPRRTIEDWERGVRTPSEWSLDLIIEKLKRIKGEDKMFTMKEIQEMLNGEILFKTNFTGEMKKSPDETIYEYKIDDKEIFYRHSGTTDGCFWTEWK